MAAVHAWLATYPHGTRRMTVPHAAAREYCHLPEFGWLSDRLQEQGCLHTLATDTRRVEVSVRSLVALNPGSVYSIFVNMGREALALWEYYKRPFD
eukprot:1220642-Alexandrium_andersonii.AAC.1